MANHAKHKETEFKVGDIVKVYQKIREDAEKSRVQIFEGIVISIKSSGDATFTVRKISSGGIGVEKIFPLESPTVERIEVKKHGKVRRAKLYYLRDRVGKRALKVREKDTNKTKKTEKKKSA